MTTRPGAGSAFRYGDYELDLEKRVLTCNYSLGPYSFEEVVTFDRPTPPRTGHPVDRIGADAAARLVHLLAGVSYFKTVAPDAIDLGELATSAQDRAFLRDFYVDGLAEYAFVNRVELGGIQVRGPERSMTAGDDIAEREPSVRPLVPFGGGIDSVVTAESVRATHPDTALFVVSRPGDRFAAIERTAEVSGLPVLRAERRIDPALLDSSERGFRNGHVPVTGIISAIAILAAILDGRDAVVMSNERSASSANLVDASRSINHQWSKSVAFETGFRDLLQRWLPGGPVYFSFLRPCSELWVARRFATLAKYHGTFRSCNRSFRIDPAARLDRWCGVCDKCCFVDLVLAPFLPVHELDRIFDGHEPLTNPALLEQFRVLIGASASPKPFECVGDVDECRAAVLLASDQADRAENDLLEVLSSLVKRSGPQPDPMVLLEPRGAHFVPSDFALEALVG